MRIIRDIEIRVREVGIEVVFRIVNNVVMIFMY